MILIVVKHYSKNYTTVDPKQFHQSCIFFGGTTPEHRHRVPDQLEMVQFWHSTMKICSWHWRPGPQKSWRWTLIKLKVDKMVINNKIKSWSKIDKKLIKAKEGSHTNHPPPPTWRETKGDNRRQDHFRAQEGNHTNQHLLSKGALRTPTNCLGKTKNIYIYMFDNDKAVKYHQNLSITKSKCPC